MPAVSVVMPAYNAQPWFDQAVSSILGQTLTDLELVILDDGSTDGTRSAANEWRRRDERVRVIVQEGPQGLVASANTVVRAARGDLIARMDADDVSHPHRLERQVEVLAAAPEVVLIGTLSDGIDSFGHRVRPMDRGRLLASGPFPPFPHGSVMFRRAAFDSIGGYRGVANGWEDIDLMVRLTRVGDVQVIPHALYSYRYHDRNNAITLPEDAHLAALHERDRHIIGHERSERDARAEMAYTRVAMCVWAGIRPATRVRVGRTGFRMDRLTLGTLLYRSWGNAHPPSLRAALAVYLRMRDLYASRKLPIDRPVLWRFG